MYIFMVVFYVHSSRTRAEQSLVRWATPQLHDIDALAKMVDPALKGLYPVKSLSRFADVIALCVQVIFIFASCINFEEYVAWNLCISVFLTYNGF